MHYHTANEEKYCSESNSSKRRLVMCSCIQLTPVYRSQISKNELQRLRITLSHNNKWKHGFFGPESMDYSEISREFPESMIFKFPDRYFISIRSYSELLLEVEYYQTFQAYKSILITQLDSIVVNEIPEYLVDDYDYVGAAWEKPFWIFSLNRRLVLSNHWILRLISREIIIGNGGLSIRNVKSTIEVLAKFYKTKKTLDILELNLNLNEDVVISFLMHKYKKRIPSLLDSQNYFLEAGAKNVEKFTNALGFHALEVFNPSLEARILKSSKRE